MYYIILTPPHPDGNSQALFNSSGHFSGEQLLELEDLIRAHTVAIFHNLHDHIGRDVIEDSPLPEFRHLRNSLVSQNGACLVGELFPHPIGVCCTHLEPPNCNISENRCFFELFRFCWAQPLIFV